MNLKVIKQESNPPTIVAFKWFYRQGNSKFLRSPVANKLYGFRVKQWSRHIKRLSMCGSGWHCYPNLKAAREHESDFWRDNLELWMIELENPHVEGMIDGMYGVRPVNTRDLRSLWIKVVGTRMRLIRKVVWNGDRWIL